MIEFGNPRGAWLFALLAVFLVVLARRLRRKSVRLTTFFILRRMADKFKLLHRRFRLLRRLSYIFFIAAASLIALAALKPFYASGRKPLRELALVDFSPSLGVNDGGAPRIGSMRRAVRDYVERLRPQDDLYLISAGHRATASVRLPGGDAAAGLADGLEYSDVPADIDGALILASAVAAAGSIDHLLIFTDRPGRWRAAPRFPAISAMGPRFIGSGVSRPNAGITRFDIRRDFFNPSSYDLYLEVRNLAAAGAALGPNLSVTVLNNGKEVKTARETCPPGEKREVVLLGLSLEPGMLEARLDPGGDYAGDDTVLAGISAGRSVKVKARAAEDGFLAKALSANQAVELQLIGPDEKLVPDERAVYIFEGAVPEGVLPQRALFIQPTGKLEGLNYRGVLARANRVEADRMDPVLRGVDMEGLQSKGLFGYEASVAFRAPATVDGHPLILLSDDPARRWAVLTFDPVQTKFIYSASYPILVANLVHWLSTLTASDKYFFMAGNDVVLPGPASGGTVVTPGGQTLRLNGNEGSGVLLAECGRAGRYRVFSESGESLGDFFMNVLDPEVSVEPAAPGYGEGATSLPGDLRRGPYRIDLVAWLALAALLILAVESWISRYQASGRE